MDLQTGLNLDPLLRERGLTQTQLADRLGVMPSTVSRWVTGERAPVVARLPGIAQALGCSVSNLFVRAAPGGHTDRPA